MLYLFHLQLDLWKRVITFEKSNPLRSEDAALVTRRVMFATEQCLLVLTHHPAVWHQAAQYLDQSAKLLTEKGVRNTNENEDYRLKSHHASHIHWKFEYRCIVSVRLILSIALQKTFEDGRFTASCLCLCVHSNARQPMWLRR